MIKNYIDEANFEDTGFSYTLSLISGKHKLVILYCLMEFEVVRFNELKRYLKKVSDKTLSNNLKELEADLNENGENEGSLSGLVIDKEDINRKYHKYTEELEDIISTDNLERFSKQLTFYSKETLLKIRRLLNGIKECHTEFILSRAMDYAAQIDSEKNKKLLKATQERIDFVNLSRNTVDMMDVISNEEVVEILYEFIKVQIIIMDLGQITQDNPKFQRFSKVVRDIQYEIKKNKNKGDIKIRKLDELLQKIFNDLSISDLSDLDAITDELLEALERARNINYENERLSKLYGGNYAFVKTYQDAVGTYPADRSEIERTLVIIYGAVGDALDKEIVTIQGRKNFADSVKSKVTKTLLKEDLHKKIKSFYVQLLYDLYTNIQLFK